MIERKGSKWIVLTRDGSRVLGTHDTKEKAQRQLTAIHASKATKEATMPNPQVICRFRITHNDPPVLYDPDRRSNNHSHLVMPVYGKVEVMLPDRTTRTFHSGNNPHRSFGDLDLFFERLFDDYYIDDVDDVFFSSHDGTEASMSNLPVDPLNLRPICLGRLLGRVMVNTTGIPQYASAVTDHVKVWFALSDWFRREIKSLLES